ncbi:MAG: glutamate mutase L [Candidatus Izemoplasmatales bacterium]|nr:glutamate mutase L [bacterium]MDZ4195905.1 glutamate mutase L [Candidatus Izemoplasmatales bacterium]
MKIDAFVAEIGSTTTVVSAFDGLHTNTPRFLGQGMAQTSVLSGDVTIGLQEAIAQLQQSFSGDLLEPISIYATSSAAGGLKMSVHGLVYDMTVKAAKEAALGAGGNVSWVTSGLLSDEDLKQYLHHSLNMILIAGGVDYGESKTALENARNIASLSLPVPVVYAGNIVNHAAVKAIFHEKGLSSYLSIAPNVYPKIDQLEVDEVRLLIQNAFEKHITEAPGMEKIRQIITNKVIPTPGAVMKATQLAATFMSDVLCIDVGGATSDVHSVSEGTIEIQAIQTAPEPVSKRTVEGDIGIYINKDTCVSLLGKSKLATACNMSLDRLEELLASYPPIPSGEFIPIAQELTKVAVHTSISRHVGKRFVTYSQQGKITLASGKDLSAIQSIICTGGALVKLPNPIEMVKEAWKKLDPLALLPKEVPDIYIDQYYIMAAIGVLVEDFPIGATALLKHTLKGGR